MRVASGSQRQVQRYRSSWLLASLVAFSLLHNAEAQQPPHTHDADHAHDHDHDHAHDHDHSHAPGRHVHGEVTFNVVLEGSELTAELNAPAIHVVGFERAAQNDQERAKLAAANAWLASGRGFLGVPRTAACRPVAKEFSPPAAGAEHADYRARHSYRCANPKALPWVELWAVRELEGVEKVIVNLIANGRQQQVVVDGSVQRISLR